MFRLILTVTMAVTLTSYSVDSFEERTVFGKLKSGIHLAGKLLGIDQATGVAQLVTEAFGKTHKKGDGAEAPSNIFSGFLRVLGFDAKKVGAIAINAIIFVAQLISSSLSGTPPSQLTEARKVRQGSPLEWIMNNTEVVGMISHIKDKELPNHLVQFIKERSMDEETDCVQLLACKAAPFVWGMQRALEKGNSSIKGPKSFYAYLPSMEEVEDNGDLCDNKHPFCFIDI